MKMFIDDISFEPSIIASPVLTSIRYSVEKMGVPGKVGDHKIELIIDTMANTRQQEFLIKIEKDEAIDQDKRLAAVQAAAALFDEDTVKLSDIRTLFIKKEETSIEGGGESIVEGDENEDGGDDQTNTQGENGNDQGQTNTQGENGNDQSQTNTQGENGNDQGQTNTQG